MLEKPVMAWSGHATSCSDLDAASNLTQASTNRPVSLTDRGLIKVRVLPGLD